MSKANKVFYIKDNNNNSFSFEKFGDEYKFINTSCKNGIVEYNNKDKILFNDNLKDIKINPKINIELFSLFFAENFNISVKRDIDSTYIKLDSYNKSIEKNKQMQHKTISVSLTIYDTEFDNKSYNDILLYHLNLLKTLNNAIFTLIDYRNKINFYIKSDTFGLINGLFTGIKMSNIDVLNQVETIRNAKQLEEYDQEDY